VQLRQAFYGACSALRIRIAPAKKGVLKQRLLCWRCFVLVELCGLLSCMGKRYAAPFRTTRL